MPKLEIAAAVRVQVREADGELRDVKPDEVLCEPKPMVSRPVH